MSRTLFPTGVELSRLPSATGTPLRPVRLLHPSRECPSDSGSVVPILLSRPDVRDSSLQSVLLAYTPGLKTSPYLRSVSCPPFLRPGAPSTTSVSHTSDRSGTRRWLPPNLVKTRRSEMFQSDPPPLPTFKKLIHCRRKSRLTPLNPSRLPVSRLLHLEYHPLFVDSPLTVSPSSSGSLLPKFFLHCQQRLMTMSYSDFTQGT